MRILVLGGGFAGLTVALRLKARLGCAHDVALVSDRDEFVYVHALPWIPFGLVSASETSFSLSNLLAARGVEFEHMYVHTLDLPGQRLLGDDGRIVSYDRLVLATGPRADWAAIPGLARTRSFLSRARAIRTKRALRRVLEAPTPVVVGLAPGASCYGASYRFVLQVARELRGRGHAAVPVTFITPEPFLGHFGVGGLGAAPSALPEAFDSLGIRAELNAEVRAVRTSSIVLADEREVPFGFAMILPAFTAADPIRACPELLDAAGYVRVDAQYRTLAYPEVYAAGSTVAIGPLASARAHCGVPRSPMMAEEMGRVVAHNLAAEILGETHIERTPAELIAARIRACVNDESLVSVDPFMDGRPDAWSAARLESHSVDVALARWGLSERAMGAV